MTTNPTPAFRWDVPYLIEKRARRLAVDIARECRERHGVDVFDPCVASDLGWGVDELWNSMCLRAAEAVGTGPEDDALWRTALDKVAEETRAECLKEAAGAA